MKFEIVDLEEFSGSKAKIYSIMFDGDDQTLLDHFFEDNQRYENDLKEIASKLVNMGNTTGCRIQYFKENEGVPGDGVVALWYHSCLSRRSSTERQGTTNEGDSRLH